MASGSIGDFGAGDFGGAVQGLFAAKGAYASASSYGEAASIAEQNAALIRESTRIKEQQLQRQIYQSLGSTKAEVGGSGFAASGSALDILKSSASQGAITKAMLSEQGAITELSYQEQAQQFKGMQNAALSAAEGEDIGAGIQAVGGIIGAVGSAYSVAAL